MKRSASHDQGYPVVAPKQPIQDARSASALARRSGLVLLILTSSGHDEGTFRGVAEAAIVAKDDCFKFRRYRGGFKTALHYMCRSCARRRFDLQMYIRLVHVLRSGWEHFRTREPTLMQ